MYRYGMNKQKGSSLQLSSGLIRRSNPFKNAEKISKSIPKSLYIRKVGNQIINIHNTTIKVQPSAFSFSKESLSPKKLILRRRKQRARDNQLRDFEQNFKITNLNKQFHGEVRDKRSKTLESQSINKFQPRHYKTLDVEPKTIDDELGLANQTIERQLQTIDIDMPSLINYSLDWSSVKIPMTPHRAIKKFFKYLTNYESKQIFNFIDIYFIGHEAHKIKMQNNVGFDNKEGEYHLVMKDHIAYRYQILEVIGAGAFGQCAKAYDHKRKQICAIKLIRNKPNFSKQGLVELNLLKFISEYDINGKANVVKVIDSVTFRKHLVKSQQNSLLDISLYTFLKMSNFQGFNCELIRKFAVQILQSLYFLKSHQIAHCDLKPQNILLKKIGKSGVKIIDFGTSCFIHQKYFTYIQSRFYRAPQIVLGLPYDAAIDMWSFGCIISQLYLGTPLFPGESESEHIRLMYQVIGPPSSVFLKKCQKGYKYFDYNGSIHPEYKKLTKSCARNVTKLDEAFAQQKDLLQMLKKCLMWDPAERLQPKQALMDKFIVDGLPQKIRKEHLKQMNSQSPYGLF